MSTREHKLFLYTLHVINVAKEEYMFYVNCVCFVYSRTNNNKKFY